MSLTRLTFVLFVCLAVQLCPARAAAQQGQILARYGQNADGARARREMAPAFEEQRSESIQGALERSDDSQWTASLHNVGTKSYSITVKLMQFDADGQGLGSVGFTAQIGPGQRVTRNLQAATGAVSAELRVERSTPIG